VTVYRGFTEHFGNDIVWWIVFIVVLTVVLLLELVITVLRKVYWPTLIEVWQELEQDGDIRRRLEKMSVGGGYGIGDTVQHTDA
jgi:phospholipid-translocating ATPase